MLTLSVSAIYFIISTELTQDKLFRITAKKPTKMYTVFIHFNRIYCLKEKREKTSTGKYWPFQEKVFHFMGV